MDGVVDDLFNELRGLFVAAVSPAAGRGSAFVGSGLGEIDRGDLEAVEEETGAARVDLVGGDAAEDLADGDLNGGAILGKGEVEGGLVALAGLAFPFWDWPTIFMVVEAEVFVAERWTATAVAGGEDVAALEAWFWCVCVGHVWGPPSPALLLKSSNDWTCGWTWVLGMS